MSGSTEDLRGVKLPRFKRYPAYKESGIQWFGETPAHWSVAPVYARYEVALGKMLDSKRVTGYSSGRYLRNVDVQWDSINTMDLPEMDFPPSERDRYLLRPGDLLVCEGGEVGRTAIWRGEIDECYYQKALHRVRPRTQSEAPRFLYYLMSALAKRGVFSAGGNQNTIDHLTAVQLRHYRLPFAPPDEQRHIAVFLDRETAKIDVLVAKKERLIELLEEERAAVITQVVTKGLDPEAQTKSSDVVVLGAVPVHWQVRRLRHLSPRLGVGVVVNPSSYIAYEGVPFLYGSDILEGSILHGQARRISPDDSARLQQSRLEADDLVMVRVGAPGVTAVVPPDLQGANCASVLIIRRSLLFDSSWLCYALNSRAVRSQVELVQYGAAQEQFNVSHALDFLVPVPPLHEQRRISAFLHEHSARYRALVESVRKAISALQELRVALISAAVTGRIDVREEVA